ncbi:MAG: type II secretion system F family protein [Chthonomonadales bacterium]|nr:type II secretion system F family protein [Chthonomonadales bacterium]
MPDFRYSALDRSGKPISGALDGRDAQDAAARVRALGFYPVSVKEASANGRARAGRDGAQAALAGATAGGKRVPRTQILLFTRELADLIDAGLPIDRALRVLIEQSDHELLQAMVRHLQEDIRAGKPLSEALRAYPREFPDLYANMIHAGEVSGQLPGVMARLADFLEREQVRRSQVMAALTYPMVLITVALVAVTFLLTFVIPRLQDVFKDLGAALPMPTQILLATSGFVVHRWYWIVAAGFLAWLAARSWVRTGSGRRSFDGMRLSLPLVGVLTRKMVMARFTRTLGTLLGGGVPVLESLAISGTAVGNTVTADAVLGVRDQVRQGETLATSMEVSGAFLPLVVHMSAVGEETGQLARMLVRTADTLDFEVDNAMRRLTSLVEPVIVLLMGSFVGFVVLSILLPIFQASTVVH